MPLLFKPYNFLKIFFVRILMSSILVVLAQNAFCFVKFPDDIYFSLSGGYGLALQQAHENEGAGGFFRLGLGSLWKLDQKSLFGGELALQTNNPIRLDNKTSDVVGLNAVPIYYHTKTAIDLLLIAKRYIHQSVFAEAKAGGIYLSTFVTENDIRSHNAWLPEAQFGFGVGLSKHSRILLNYQHFFGHPLKITALNPNDGTFSMSGTPNWRALVLTLEAKV